MYAARQAPKWVPPLPPGWEAKFDPGQHTYFFINHLTKTTQWEDPRFQQQPAPAPTPGPTASAAATNLLRRPNNRSLNKSGRTSGSSSRYESVQMREFGNATRGGQSHSQGESSLTNVEGIMQKLQAEFPAATRELISDMLTSCQNSEARTRQQLKNLGFGVKPASSGAGHSSSSLTPTTSNNRATSPNRKTSRGASPARPEQQHPKSQTSTPKREVSEADRARIINLLKGEFPDRDPNVVTIAASTCNYDLDHTRELIKAFQKQESEEGRSTTSRAGATSSSYTSSASCQPSQPSQQSLLPASLSDTTPRQGSSKSSKPRKSSHTRGPASTSHAVSARDGAGDGSARGDKGRSSQPQHARAEQVTRPRQKQARQQAAVVTSQPSASTAATTHRPATDSSNRTTIMGPNRELRRGPDSSLLMSEYIHAQGPNRDLRCGPDHSRVAGPQGCNGPDAALVCGPQHNIVLNQQRDRVVTPSGVLVSNI